MKKGTAALDQARFAAALLVVAIHTSPLMSLSPDADFFLTRILARLAVPLFFMASGYFLGKSGWARLPHFLRKTALYYAAALVLYLPLNLYQGGWVSLGDGLRALFFDGTLYHLWYFPAVLLGACIAAGLARLGLHPALALAGTLYLFGLLGDSYYGLAVRLGLEPLFSTMFQVFSYTRNGLFFAPLFLLLGAAGRQFSTRIAGAGCIAAFAAMTAEGFALHRLGLQRHDSMYLFLPLCMVFLFSLLLRADSGQNVRLRRMSMLVYLLHPWWIVLVRGAAKVLHLEGVLIQSSVIHYLAVAAASVLCAFVFSRWPQAGQPTARAWREIDLDALRHNAAQLQAALGPGCALIAVVKADAYGHGAGLVARALQKSGVPTFAVATLEEGVALRKCGVRKPILILGYTDPSRARTLARWRLTQTVADEAHARALAAQRVPLRVHLAVDTGMHRLGIPAHDMAAFFRVFDLPYLRIDGMFSHLGVSDSLSPADAAYTQAQLAAFRRTIQAIRQAGYAPGALHIQASYGIWNLPPQPCQFARAGIALYGVLSQPGEVARPLDLQPVLALRTRVVLVRTLDEGQTAGYGQAFRAARPSRLAVLSIGYADGIPRAYAHGGMVLLRGRRAPVVGRVCMDQLLVDVTDLPDVQAGDVATLIGRDGAEEIHAEQAARWCGTITNELLSRIGPRVKICAVESHKSDRNFDCTAFHLGV